MWLSGGKSFSAWTAEALTIVQDFFTAIIGMKKRREKKPTGLWKHKQLKKINFLNNRRHQKGSKGKHRFISIHGDFGTAFSWAYSS